MKDIALICIFILFFVFLCPMLSEGAPGLNYSPDEYVRSDYISYVNSEISNSVMAEEKVKESPFRRFEVTFFISLPFSFIINFLAFNVFSLIKNGETIANIWEETRFPVGILALSYAIAYREAIICHRMNREKYGRLPEKSPVFFSFSRSY